MGVLIIMAMIIHEIIFFMSVFYANKLARLI